MGVSGREAAGKEDEGMEGVGGREAAGKEDEGMEESGGREAAGRRRMRGEADGNPPHGRKRPRNELETGRRLGNRQMEERGRKKVSWRLGWRLGSRQSEEKTVEVSWRREVRGNAEREEMSAAEG